MFSAPLWLLGLFALAVPIAIHLWSRRPRTVIRVGSLRHLGELPEARSWSTRLTDPLLLACRLAILTFTVLALAGPRLALPPLGSIRRLVLIEPELLSDSALRSDPAVDSLIRSAGSARLLAPGLPDAGAALRVPRGADSPDPLGPGNAPHGALWTRLAEADRLVAPGGIIDVIARPRIINLGGRRPVLAARVRWHVPARSGTRWWLADAWLTPADSVQVLLGKGDAGEAEYTALRVRPPGAPAEGRRPALDIRKAGDGSVWLQLPGAGGEVRAEPAAPHRVALDTHGDTALSRRLRAAIEAIGEELGEPVSLLNRGDSADALVTLPPLRLATREDAGELLTVDSATAAGMTLADSLLARWPWPPSDHADPREASLRQAEPLQGLALRPGDARPVRGPLFLLAMVLIALERWLALRPGRRA
jgi:hypothetical protein